jgi:hypothetical protein
MIYGCYITIIDIEFISMDLPLITVGCVLVWHVLSWGEYWAM